MAILPIAGAPPALMPPIVINGPLRSNSSIIVFFHNLIESYLKQYFQELYSYKRIYIPYQYVWLKINLFLLGNPERLGTRIDVYLSPKFDLALYNAIVENLQHICAMVPCIMANSRYNLPGGEREVIVTGGPFIQFLSSFTYLLRHNLIYTYSLLGMKSKLGFVDRAAKREKKIILERIMPLIDMTLEALKARYHDLVGERSHSPSTLLALSCSAVCKANFVPTVKPLHKSFIQQLVRHNQDIASQVCTDFQVSIEAPCDRNLHTLSLEDRYEKNYIAELNLFPLASCIPDYGEQLNNLIIDTMSKKCMSSSEKQ